MLQYTGHPLFDVGVAAITAYAGKTDPATVVEADLDEIADYLERIYSDGIGRNFAAGIVFPNSGFGQPAFDRPEFRHKRAAYADQVLRGYRTDRPSLGGEVCVFTQQPAYMRATREMFPLLNGRDVINFGPQGRAGLPVSGIALLAVHAMPLGCVISQGRLLAVTSDDPELMFEFARENVERNRRFFQMDWLESVPNWSSFKTRLIEKLVEISRRPASTGRYLERSPSVTAYHFSNAGQDARIDIYELPSPVTSFLFLVARGEYQQSWEQIVARAWIEDHPEDEELQKAKPKITRRNLLYEDIFGLPDNARFFLRTYILRQPLKRLKNDPRASYATLRESDLVSWNLTELFLRRMMNMEKKRIDNIRKFADQLAQYIQRSGDRKLLPDLYLARSNEYWKVRSSLLRAAQAQPPDQGPLVEFDTYVSVFEEGREGERLDWQLARDLLLIRIIEQLHRARSTSLEVLNEVVAQAEAESANQS